MAGYIMIGSLAAYGALCVLWTLFGWLLPPCGKALGCICLDPGQGEAAVLRYRWLRNLGIVRGPLLIVGAPLPGQEDPAQSCPGVQYCNLEELASRLELEREHLE